jgi:hypothetical protein
LLSRPPIARASSPSAKLDSIRAIILDPTTVPKYTTPMIIPPAMPRISEITLPGGALADY